MTSQAKRLDGAQQHQSVASPPRKPQETFQSKSHHRPKIPGQHTTYTNWFFGRDF